MTPTLKFDSRTFWLLLAAGAGVLALVGCTTQQESGFESDEESTTAVAVRPDTLNITAIGVPNFSDEIARQWAAERDGQVNITHVTPGEFFDSKSRKKADLFVHPSTILADLVSEDLLRVYPREGLVSASMNVDSYLAHFRKVGVRHNDKTWSVSLGGQQLRLFYRSDVLEVAGIDPPKTWEELDRAIEKVQQAEEAKDLLPVVVPSSEGHSVQLYLARLASELRDRGKLTFFFDRRTMQPTLDAPVFAGALEDLRNYNQLGQPELCVSETFELFAAGKAVFAIAWPTLGDDFDTENLEKASANWGVTRLPGSERTYDLKESSWRDRQTGAQQKVDLLGMASTSISISKRSSHANDAVEFVTWISEKQNSRKLLRNVAAPFRATHLGRVGEWYALEQANGEFLDALADSIEETHQSDMVMTFPMLPGTRQYLKLLDSGIRKFLSTENAGSEKALQDIGAQWESLTESLGRENQIRELKRGNGI